MDDTPTKGRSTRYKDARPAAISLRRSAKTVAMAALVWTCCLSTALADDGVRVWNGASGGNWSVATNWLPNDVPDSPGETALFDSTRSGNSTINLVGGATVPIIVDASTDYAIHGVIAGDATITKRGTGKLTLGGSPSTFTGAVTIEGGTLVGAKVTAMGSASGATTISAGGTLDVDGRSHGAEQIFVSGAGVDGLGAIVSNHLTAVPIPALRFVTLTAPATFGGEGSWFIGGTALNPATLSMNGHDLTINCTTGNVAITGASIVDPGDVVVAQGRATFGRAGLSFAADATRTLTVKTGAVLVFDGFPQTTAASRFWAVKSEDGSTITNSLNGSRIYPTIELLGDVTIALPSGGMTVYSDVVGSGGFTKTGNQLVMPGANTYSGATVIKSGLLNAISTGTFASPSITIEAPATLRGSGSYTLLAGQTVHGTGLVFTGSLLTNNGTLSPGISGQDDAGTLTVNHSVSFNNGSKLKIELDSGVSDLLQINTGTVGLGNAILDVSLLPSFSATRTGSGSVFPVIVNNGAGTLSGEFAGLADKSIVTVGNATFQIHYGYAYNDTTANDVVLIYKNTSPDAQNDEYSTAEDTTLNVVAPGVLGNDTDPDADDVLYAETVMEPAHGDLTLNADGSFAYVPDANWYGTDDAAVYIARDGEGGDDLAYITFHVAPVNDAPVAHDDSATTDEDIAVTVNVLANDSDIEGSTLSVDSVGTPSNGSVAVNSDNTITYTPNADFNGTDSFTYEVSDGSATSTGTVNVTVNAVNDAPVAVDEAGTVAEGGSITGSVLGNDTDADGDTLTITAVTQGANGTVTNHNDGTLTYKHNGSETTEDSFTYTISDGNGGSDTATVTITVTPVNDAPVAGSSSDSVTTPEDTAVEVGILANFTDAEGDTLSLSGASTPAHGSVTLNEDGTVTYTPDLNYHGADTFTVQVSDGNGGEATFSVYITVTPANDAPTISSNNNSAGPVDEGQTATLGGSYADVDGDTVTLSASKGTVTKNNGTWSWSYTTSDGPAQSGEVTITVNDGKGGTANTSFNLTVSNVAPQVGDISGLPLAPIQTGTAAATVDATISFSDAGTGDTHTASWNWGDGSTSAGTVTENNGSGTASGSHTYTEAGVYSVTVTVQDSDGASASAAYQYVVVYAPEDGFVTGGGWINSPAGAYSANPGLSGKANFGFNSKYKNGQSTPSGDTDFHFQAAGFKFKSTNYEWMVISGTKVRYRGVGTVNGSGSYGFELTAIDGGNGGSADRFRLKVWSANRGNATVYDNLTGAPDGSDPTTIIGGGNITIHKGS